MRVEAPVAISSGPQFIALLMKCRTADEDRYNPWPANRAVGTNREPRLVQHFLSSIFFDSKVAGHPEC